MIDDSYSYENLTDKDKQFVNGFKWCVEESLDTYFDNCAVAFSDDFLSHFLNEKVPEFMRDEYTMERTFQGKTETRKIETYGDLLRSEMLDWCTMQLSELMISMLDNYDKEDEEE